MVNLQETESGIGPVDLFPSPHPLTPPLSAEDEAAWLRLLRSRRVGVATFFRLMNEHGTAQAALEALPEVAAAAGVKDYQLCPLAVVEDELKRARFAGARLVAWGASDYPAALTDIPDAPPLLWTMGDTQLLQKPMIALVGARNASSLGTRMARKLAADLADAGFVVVSGLARGVDTAAHSAALEHGTTAAVLAGGVDVIYPTENTVLAEEIARKGRGIRISEQPMGLSPIARHFPRRNRIISGLARAVVVVEAAAKSGTLITARNALDQGRDVLAVPGHPFDARASGCNMLIRDGAALIRGADDVIEAIGAAQDTGSPPEIQAEVQVETARSDPARSHANQLSLHQQILDRLGPSPIAEDQLIRDIGVEARKISQELTDLELDGQITRQPGGLLALSN